MADKYSTYRWTNAWGKTYFSGSTENINMIKPTQPVEGDMYLSPADLTSRNFQNIQIYNDLEWNTQLYYSTSGYGPCYWLRTPYASQPCLSFLHRSGENVDHDGSNPARAVVFCIAL